MLPGDAEEADDEEWLSSSSARGKLCRRQRDEWWRRRAIWNVSLVNISGCFRVTTGSGESGRDAIDAAACSGPRHLKQSPRGSVPMSDEAGRGRTFSRFKQRRLHSGDTGAFSGQRTEQK